MMKLLRKWLILTHRYAGIVLSLLVVMWFATGITMMYAGGMPRLTPEMRLEKLPSLDLARVRLTPAEAAEAGLVDDPGRAVLLSIMGGRRTASAPRETDHGVRRHRRSPGRRQRSRSRERLPAASRASPKIRSSTSRR